MDERDFFIEARTRRPAILQCPFCRDTGEHSLEWMVRKKRTNINLDRLDERDRARFQKAASYMVLLDDMVTCAQSTCRRRFEISGVKTMAFVTPEQLENVDFRGDGRSRAPQQDRGNEGRDTGRRVDTRSERGHSRGAPQANRPPAEGRAKTQGPAKQGNKGKVRPNRDEDYGNRIDDPELPSHLTYREPGSAHPGFIPPGGGRPAQGRPGGRNFGQNQQRSSSGKGKGAAPPAGKRKGPSGPRNQPTRHEEGQPLRSPRGKRSDPTGPGGGWR